MKSVLIKVGISTAVVAGIIALFALFAPYYSTQLWWELRKELFFWLPLLGLLLAVAAVFVATVWSQDRKDKRSSRYHDNSAVSLVPLVAVGILGLAALGFWVFGWHSYEAKATYAQHTQQTDQPVPDFGQRAPFSVAEAQAKSNLSSVPNTTLEDGSTSYLPNRETYTSLVKVRSGISTGYAAVISQKFEAGGRAKATTCKFSDKAGARLEGNFSGNLGRKINSAQRGVNWSTDDAYGYCDGDTPMVVVPLKKQVGILVVTERFAGVAIYNGKTGEVTIDRHPTNVPGAVYPESLAKKQREATSASGSFSDWMFNRVGFEPASDESNEKNSSEYLLRQGEHGAEYATLLRSKNSSGSGITAVGTVDGHFATYGDLAPLKIHTLNPAWVSLDAIVQRIKADYQDIPNWNTISVQEIAPLGANRWVATIGNSQNILYRVEGTGDLNTPMPVQGAGDSVTCLYKQPNLDTPIRCGTAALQGSNGVGTQYGAQTPTNSTPQASVPTGDLGKLSDADLARLNQQISDEISKRLGQK